jgi:hypothetical protein
MTVVHVPTKYRPLIVCRGLGSKALLIPIQAADEDILSASRFCGFTPEKEHSSSYHKSIPWAKKF